MSLELRQELAIGFDIGRFQGYDKTHRCRSLLPETSVQLQLTQRVQLSNRFLSHASIEIRPCQPAPQGQLLRMETYGFLEKGYGSLHLVLRAIEVEHGHDFLVCPLGVPQFQVQIDET